MEIADFLDADPVEVERPVTRGLTGAAWLLILIVAGFVVFTQHLSEPPPAAEGQVENTQQSMHLYLMELQGKYLVSAAQMDPRAKKDLFQAAKPMNSGPVLNRLRFTILAAELAGPNEALKQLRKLRERLDKNELEVEPVLPLLETLYQDYQDKDWTASSLTEEQKKQVVSELGWFGELAFVPEEAKDPKRGSVLATTQVTVMAFIGGTMAMLAFGFCGLSLLVVFIVLLCKRRVPFRLSEHTNAGGIYAETFALWMTMFLVLNFATAALRLEEHALLLSAVIFLSSLTALIWPVIRGVSWSQVRQDIGWTSGQNPIIEILYGIGAYLSTLPVLVVAALVTLILAGIQAQMMGGRRQ